METIKMKAEQLELSEVENKSTDESETQQELIPLLLPEIWDPILEGLPPTDFLSAINSSVEWNKLMHIKKPDILISLVFPLVMEYLPLDTMLNCRLVEKTIFKSVVDSVFQELSVNSEKYFDYNSIWLEHLGKFIQGRDANQTKAYKVRELYEFDCVEIIQEFLQRMEPSPGDEYDTLCNSNPFLAKHICISVPIVRRQNNLYTEEEEGHTLLPLLSRYGHHVSSLTFRMVEYINHPVSLTRFIPTLAALPNLKILQLQSIVPATELQYVRRELLPDLPQLEFLCVKWFRIDGDPEASDVPLILPLLQRYGSQLKGFTAEGNFLKSTEMGVELLSELLPNLRLMEAFNVNPQTMIKLGMVKWPLLEKLKLKGLFQVGHRSCRLGHLVKALNNFSETLTSLELFLLFSDGNERGPKEVVKEGEMKPLLKLKKLSTAIQILGTQWFLETFTKESCPSLEELEFQQDDYIGKHICHTKGAFSLIHYKMCYLHFPSLKKIGVWFIDKKKWTIRCKRLTCVDVNCKGNACRFNRKQANGGIKMP